MKKVLSILLGCILTFTTFGFAVSAEDITAGNYAVIRDCDGNIVEFFPMTRSTYVDSVHTIPAKGTFTTYYYKPSFNFAIGFKFYDDSGNLVTTRNRTVSLTINKFTGYGVGEDPVVTKTFSTNIENNTLTPSGESYEVSIETSAISDDHPYYNGVYKNLSSSSLKIRVCVTMD